MKNKLLQNKKVRKIVAEQLKYMVEDHKKHCKEEKCPINTYLFLILFEELIERKLTDKEMEVFF